jgi:hypothetical protein
MNNTNQFPSDASDIQDFSSSTERLNLYLVMIFTATLLPLFLIPTVSRMQINTMGIVAITSFIELMAGSGHVGLTCFFYTDPQMQSFFKAHPIRYIYLPILLVLGMGTAFYVLPETYTSCIFSFHLIWQTYHYQRQNYGILRFLNIASGGDKITKLERAIIEIAAISGIFGLIKVSNFYFTPLIYPLTDTLYQIGLALTALVIGLLILAVVSVKSLRLHKLRLSFLIISALFYVPTFFVANPTSAIASYAYAHGFQYFVFMYFTASSHQRENNDGRIVLLVMSSLAGVLALTLMSDKLIWGGLGKFVWGMFIGLVMSHFVIDAGIWRGDIPFKRRYMKTSFDFILSRQNNS